MILYIAGPISGIENRNLDAFAEAEVHLTSAGYVVLNPASKPGMDNGADDIDQYHELLKRDMRFLLECDGVASIEGWWNSVGARNEVQCAAVLGLPIRSPLEWVQRADTELNKIKKEWVSDDVQH